MEAVLSIFGVLFILCGLIGAKDPRAGFVALSIVGVIFVAVRVLLDWLGGPGFIE